MTDLSPLPICQGATDPAAIGRISGSVPVAVLSHLPRLHAKVYIADKGHAIVTSGNLTAGGLVRNFEYGVEIIDPASAAQVYDDMTSYAALGAFVHKNQLEAYSEIAERVRASYRKQMTAVGELARAEFVANLRDAEDELIRIRLGGGAMHSVFARTIRYILKRYGPLTTKDLHPLIEGIHPDLCDNTIDRVIDGKHFGKKWKHAVRTAQQMLKKGGEIGIDEGKWKLL